MNSPLADLTPEERKEALQLLENTPIDDIFIDMFCEMFNITQDYIIGLIDNVRGEGVSNEKEN